jgi:hypothetical protein
MAKLLQILMLFLTVNLTVGIIAQENGSCRAAVSSHDEHAQHGAEDDHLRLSGTDHVATSGICASLCGGIALMVLAPSEVHPGRGEDYAPIPDALLVLSLALAPSEPPPRSLALTLDA